MMFVFIIPFAFGGIAGPSIQGIISNEVPANEQGELQGALTSMMSATAIVGPLLMTGLFAYFTKPGAPINFPGAPFLMGAIFTIVSAIFAYKNLKAKDFDKAKAEAIDEIKKHCTSNGLPFPNFNS